MIGVITILTVLIKPTDDNLLIKQIYVTIYVWIIELTRAKLLRIYVGIILIYVSIAETRTLQ